MDKEREVAYLGNGEGGIIVKEGFFKGKPCVDIRKYYRDWSDMDMQLFYQKQANNEVVMDGLKPTKKGVMFTDEQFLELMQSGLIPLYEKRMRGKLEFIEEGLDDNAKGA